MAENMPNRRTRINGVTESMSPGAAAAFAELATQVATLDKDYSEIKSTIVGLDRKFETAMGTLGSRMETALSGINSKVDASLSSINVKLDERGRTQWPTLASFAGLTVAVMAALGTLALRPIDNALGRLELSQITYVTKAESTIIRERLDRDMSRLDTEVKRNFEAIVPRGEHQEKWRGQEQAMLSFQRQMDDLRKDFGGTYGLRDAFRDLQQRLDKLEETRRQAAARQ